MAYPVRHKLLTLHGKLWRNAGSPEAWSVGIRFDPNGSPDGVSQAQVNAADTAIRTALASFLVNINNNHCYSYAKLAPIGIDGKYIPTEASFESAPVDLSGSGSSQVWPGQCSVATTLLTVEPSGRGRASKGRIYLPPLATTLDSSGRISNSAATAQSTFVANMIGALNDVTDLGLACVFSQVGAGVRWAISSARTGTVVDTIRRRRRQLAEAPTAPVAIP